jgi:hypothetical protein
VVMTFIGLSQVYGGCCTGTVDFTVTHA